MHIVDRDWYEKFKRRWLDQMDEEDYMTEVVKANNWLALEEGRRNKIRRLDRFFNNWLNRHLGERR